MKKDTMIIKKIVCIFLVVLISFEGLLCESNRVYSDENKQDNIFNYVSLGASNANGFGLHGYFDEVFYLDPPKGIFNSSLDVSGYRHLSNGSYPKLIKEYVETLGYSVSMNQLAQSSMRPAELRVLLDDDFYGDGFTKWRFYNTEKNTWWRNDLDDLREDYQKSIADADLITYDLGASDFSVYLVNRLTSGFRDYSADINDIDEEYHDLYDSFLKKLKFETLLLKDVISDDIYNTIAYAYTYFCCNFDKTMELIYDFNPDANVVVVEIQNLFDGLELKAKGIPIPLDSIYGLLIRDANSYITLKSNYRKKYHFANIEKPRVEFFVDDAIKYDGNPDTLSNELKEAIDCLDTSIKLLTKFRVALGICQAKGLCSEYMPSYINHLPDFVSACEENCSELYHTVLNRTYDVLFTLFKDALNTDPIIIDELFIGASIDDLSDELGGQLIGLINNVVTRSMLEDIGQEEYFSDDEVNELINNILSDDIHRFVAVVGIRSTICNSFFTHPNINGHKEVAETIQSVIKNNSLISNYVPKLVSIDVECPQLIYPKKSISLCPEFKVIGNYSNATTKEITSECTVTIPSMNTNGKKTVTVKHDDNLEKSFDIYVFGTKSVSLNLEGRIIINYYTEYPEYQSMNYKPGVLFFKQTETPSAEQIGSAYVNNEGIEEFNTEGDYLIFQYDKLAAKEMGDYIYIVLYAKPNEGNVVFGQPQKYRITQYTNTVLGATKEAKLQTLIVDMLNYGTSAQNYFEYNLENLANKDLTAKQKGYATKTVPTVSSRTKAYSDSLSSSNVLIKSASMLLDNEISMNYYATVNSEKNISKIELLAFNDYVKDNTYDENTAIARYDMEYIEDKKQYVGRFPNIVAKDMRKMIYGRVHVVYDDGTSEYSSIRSYSIEDYAYSIINNPKATKQTKDLVKSMICYGDSASAYLNRKGAQ